MSLHGFRSAGHPRSLVAALVHFDVSFMVLGAGGCARRLHRLGPRPDPSPEGPDGGGAAVGRGGVPARSSGRWPTASASSGSASPLGLTTIPLLLGALAGRTLRPGARNRPAAGHRRGELRRRPAAGQPLVPARVPGSRDRHRRGGQLRHGRGRAGRPRVAEHVGWHGVFGLALVPVALAWLAFFVLAAEPPKAAGATTKAPLRRCYASPTPAGCAPSTASPSAGSSASSGYLAIFFVDRFDLSKVAPAGFAALCAVAGSLLRPVGGALADRIGGTRLLTGVLGRGRHAGAASVGPAPAGADGFLLAVLLGVLGMGNGAVFQLVGVRMPTRVGAMTGLVGAAGGLGGFAPAVRVRAGCEGHRRVRLRVRCCWPRSPAGPSSLSGPEIGAGTPPRSHGGGAMKRR